MQLVDWGRRERARIVRARTNSALAAQGRSFGGAMPGRPARNAARVDTPLERYFDANLEGPGIWKWRHYFDAYHRHLGKLCAKPVSIVEIGIYSGGSLGMWRDYFGSDCTIYGVDIEPVCKAYESDGIHVLIGDQADPAFWERFRREVPPVDVVIDDGGHEAHQQVATLEALIGHIKPGGVYACEDIHGENNPFGHYIAGLSQNLHAHRGETTPFQRTVESVHLYPYLTVLEIAECPRTELVAPQHGTQWQPIPMPGAPTLA